MWQEIYWATALKEREDHLWESMSKARLGKRPFPLDWHNLRQFVIHNVGDALAYHSDVYHKINKESARYLIHEIVSQNINDLNSALGRETQPQSSSLHTRWAQRSCLIISGTAKTRHKTINGRAFRRMPAS